MNFAILTVEDALISHDTHDYHRAPRVSFQLPDLPEEEYSSDSPHTETSIIDDRRPTLSTTSTAATIPNTTWTNPSKSCYSQPFHSISDYPIVRVSGADMYSPVPFPSPYDYPPVPSPGAGTYSPILPLRAGTHPSVLSPDSDTHPHLISLMSSFPLTDPSSSAVSALPTIQTPSAGDQTFSLLDSSTPLYSTVPPSTVTHTYPAATLSYTGAFSHPITSYDTGASLPHPTTQSYPMHHPLSGTGALSRPITPYGTGSPSTHPSVSLPGTSVLYSPTITAQVRLYRTLQSRYLILVLYLTLSSLTTLARLYIIL